MKKSKIFTIGLITVIWFNFFVIGMVLASQNATILIASSRGQRQVNEMEATTERCRIIARGTIGSSGAPWLLCDNGIVEIGGGTVSHSGESDICVGNQVRCFASPWDGYYEYVRKIVFTEPVVAGSKLRGLFSNLPFLVEIKNADYLDTSAVTDMAYMFAGSSNLISVDVSTWNVGNVRNMGAMFAEASSLISLDVSNWDTSNVTEIWSIFSGASSLTELDMSNWDVSNIQDLHATFFETSSLVSLDVSNWDTSNVTWMNRVFSGARSLTKLDLSTWDTSNVTAMSDVFLGACNLSTLVLGNDFSFRNDLDMRRGSALPEISHVSCYRNDPFVASMVIRNPRVFRAEDYTGWWQNVGDGTIEVPNGEHILTSSELMEQFDGAIMADTFVWQPTRTHIVRQGETLSELAWYFQTTVSEFVRLNNIENPDFILIGQILIIPSHSRNVDFNW